MKRLALLLIIFCSPIVTVLGMEKDELNRELHAAISQGKIEQVLLLLKNNANPHERIGSDSLNALDKAAESRSFDMVKLLLYSVKFSKEEIVGAYQSTRSWGEEFTSEIQLLLKQNIDT